MSECRVFWNTHGCCLERGHDGPHLCDCTFAADGTLRAHASDPESDTGNVGRPPYYGPETVFFGEDSA